MASKIVYLLTNVIGKECLYRKPCLNNKMQTLFEPTSFCLVDVGGMIEGIAKIDINV